MDYSDVKIINELMSEPNEFIFYKRGITKKTIDFLTEKLNKFVRKYLSDNDGSFSQKYLDCFSNIDLSKIFIEKVPDNCGKFGRFIEYLKFISDLSINSYDREIYVPNFNTFAGRNVFSFNPYTVFSSKQGLGKDMNKIILGSKNRIPPSILFYWKNYYFFYIDEQEKLLDIDIDPFLDEKVLSEGEIVSLLNDTTVKMSINFKKFMNMYKDKLEEFPLLMNNIIPRLYNIIFHNIDGGIAYEKLKKEHPLAMINNSYVYMVEYMHNKPPLDFETVTTFEKPEITPKIDKPESKKEDTVSKKEIEKNVSILRKCLNMFVNSWKKIDFGSIVTKIKNLFVKNKMFNKENKGFFYHIIIFIKIMFEILISEYYIPFDSFVYLFYKSGLSKYFGYTDKDAEEKIRKIRVQQSLNFIDIMDKNYKKVMNSV